MAAQTSIKGKRKARVGTEENTSEHPLCIKRMRIQHQSWGVPFDELEKLTFLKYKIKRN